MNVKGRFFYAKKGKKGQEEELGRKKERKKSKNELLPRQ